MPFQKEASLSDLAKLYIFLIIFKKIPYNLDVVVLQFCTQDSPQIIILFWLVYTNKLTMFLKLFSEADWSQQTKNKKILLQSLVS